MGFDVKIDVNSMIDDRGLEATVTIIKAVAESLKEAFPEE